METERLVSSSDGVSPRQSSTLPLIQTHRSCRLSAALLLR